MSEQTQNDLWQNDPKRFRELSQPFESEKAANDAVMEFWKGVGELRVKHKITNLMIVLSSSMLTAEGEEAPFYLSMLCGAASEEEALAAFALGQAQTSRKERIGKMLGGIGMAKRQAKVQMP